MKKIILGFVSMLTVVASASGAPSTSTARKVANDQGDIAAIQKHFNESKAWAICEEWHEIEPILRSAFTGIPYEVTHLVIAPREAGSQKACIAIRKK